MQNRTQLQKGQVLLVGLAFMAVFLLSFPGLINYVILYARTERLTIASAQALALAEAGIDKAIYELNQNGGYTGEINTSLGNGTLTISISSIDSNNKRISATGYVPNSTSPTATRTVKTTANISTSIVSFRFGVQIGEGGLVMDNNSTVTGNIYSNGNISGNGTVTGDATVAGGNTTATDQQWIVQNSGFNLGDTSAHTAVSQSFKPSVSGPLNKVSLYLKKTSTPSDITVRIVSDNSGSPSSNILASGSVLASAVTGSYAFVDSSLSSNPVLVEGETYWITASAAVNASKYFLWGDDTNSGYASGAPKYASAWNSGSWTTISADMDFKTYMGGNITSLSGITVSGNAWAHTLTSCGVGGDAYYQTISGCSVGGTSHPGSSDPSLGAMPISDAQIADWETIAAAGGVIAGPYTISNTQTIGPKEINGDLIVNGTLILSGPVWVKGNISFGNGATLKVSSGLGSSGAILLADFPGSTATKGTIDLSNNVTIQGNGTAGSYPMLLTTNSGSSAIDFSNNVTGVILYASQGTVDVSNNASANEITAFKLHLNNNANVNYVSGLQSATFSNGPGGSWAIVPGSYAITN